MKTSDTSGPFRSCKYLPAVSVLALTLFGCPAITPVQKIPKQDLDEIVVGQPASWTAEQCDSIIDHFKAFNQDGYNQKISSYSVRTVDVYIEATPLNKEVIAARMRKEALNKRLPQPVFRERLRLELEDYTNFTVNMESGEIVPKQVPADSLLHEYSFRLYFENISMPHRNIEVFKAEEGFFLENEQGEFTRVIDFWGTEVQDYFILVSDLKATATFSAFTDDGKEIVFDRDAMKGYKLVFNGLQEKPITLKW